MRKIVYTIIAVFLTINLNAQVGNVNVKTWADNKKSAFSFTFDDSFISHFETVRPILNSYNFHGTFYLISGYLTETLPGTWRYGTWEQFRQMYSEGHEMGSHTVNHPDLSTLAAGNKNTPNTVHYELYQSKVTIEEKIPGAKVLTLAYPFIIHNSQIDDITDLYYEAGRSGGNGLNNNTLTYDERLGLHAKKVEFNLPRNSPSDDNDEWQNFQNYLQNLVAQNKWGTIMIHEVYPFSQINSAAASDAYYPMSSEWLTQLCNYLKQKSDDGDIWVETAGNVLKYCRQRESFSSAVISQTENQIEISVTDNLDDAIYDYPLTADIVVPSNWDTVKVTQNSSEQIVNSFSVGLQKMIRVYVVPDKGNVVLEKNAPAPPAKYIIDGIVYYSDTDSLFLSGVKISITESPGDSALTGNDGNFSFEKPAGSYEVSFFKEGSWEGVNSTDALAVLLYVTGSLQLDSMQILAADVTNDGNINATDALQILRRVSALIDSFNKPDWIFQPSLLNVNLDNTDQHFEIKAILAGDVNSSYHP